MAGEPAGIVEGLHFNHVSRGGEIRLRALTTKMGDIPAIEIMDALFVRWHAHQPPRRLTKHRRESLRARRQQVSGAGAVLSRKIPIVKANIWPRRVREETLNFTFSDERTSARSLPQPKVIIPPNREKVWGRLVPHHLHPELLS
jgi:hypothetical protein